MDNDSLAMENARYTSFRQRNFKDLFMENYWNWPITVVKKAVAHFPTIFQMSVCLLIQESH